MLNRLADFIYFRFLLCSAWDKYPKVPIFFKLPLMAFSCLPYAFSSNVCICFSSSCLMEVYLDWVSDLWVFTGFGWQEEAVVMA